jgi:ubiquinone/menaquinone biosynthesis C-methylase UbiE
MPNFGAPEELFRDTAWNYARFRPSYPREAIDKVVEHFALEGGSSAIDLGCGTGQVAIPLALRGVDVWAVDPSIEMLEQGRHEARTAGAGNITSLLGDDASFASLLPSQRFDVCVMGSSFQWMDRDAVLATLDGVISERGGVALLGNEIGVWTGDAEWYAICRDVIVEFLGPSRRAGGGVYNDPPERHETVLARSAFTTVQTHRLATRHLLSVEDIVGLQLSTSYASPALLGDRVDAFCETLADRLMQRASSGVFDWTLNTEVILARR